MAITIDYQTHIKATWDPIRFPDINEYEDFYLQYRRETLPDRIYYTNKEGIEQHIDRIDHFPNLKTYEVWSEGYTATGERGTATLIGKTVARNFRQACDIVMCTRHLEQIQKEIDPDYKEYYSQSPWAYDPHTLKDWGCRLFWSEKEAKKSFG